MPPTRSSRSEADLQQIAEGGIHAEERCEHEPGDPQPRHILSLREDLSEAELDYNKADDAAHHCTGQIKFLEQRYTDA